MLLVIATVAVAAPAACASSGDVAATRAYIRAGYTALRAAKANLPASATALSGVEHQILNGCPQVAVESPQNYDSEQLSNELVGTLTAAAYHPDASVVATFARQVKNLHWSNRTLTRAVQTSAARLKGLSTLALPDVCSDIRAWIAGGFQTLPASTVQFDQSYAAVDIEAEEVPLRLLAPYEDHASASLLRRVEAFEASIAEFEAHAVSYYVRIMNGLKLNP
jgi:hypothetical protein